MKLREYKKGDEEKIFELWHKIFGKLLKKNDVFEIESEWWDWRNLNPEGPPSVYLGVSNSEQVTAHQMIEPFQLSTPNGKKRIYASGYTMSDEKHRGLTLLKLLNTCTKKITSENAIGYGFPNENSLSIFEKFKWRYIGNVPILIRPLKLPFRVFDLKKKKKEYEIKKITQFNEDINTFMQSTDFYFDYYIDKNHNFLNWRYFKSIKKYEARLLLRNDKIEGYAVFRNSVLSNTKVGIIMDIFAKDENGFNALLNEIISYFSKEKMSYVTCFMINNGFYYKILKKRGFIKMPVAIMPKRNALIVLDNQTEQNLLNINNWYMSYGDWDCF